MSIEVDYRFPPGVDARQQAQTIAVGQTAGTWDARFAHREGTAHEQLTVEFLDRLFRGAALRVFDKRKATRAAGLAIERANDLGGIADLREMRTQVFFGCLIGQVAHEQSDWWHGEL